MFLPLLVALALAPEASAQVGPERLAGRFDTLVVTLRLRGDQPLGTIENDCVGSVGRRPALVFDYDPGDAPPRRIEVRMVSATDTVLAVLVPGERFDSSGGPAACSDDEGGELNPLVLLESPIAGRYTVLAGPWRLASWRTPSSRFARSTRRSKKGGSRSLRPFAMSVPARPYWQARHSS